MHRDLWPLAGEDVTLIAARLRHARLQENQLRVVSPIDRQVLDLTAADQLPVG